ASQALLDQVLTGGFAAILGCDAVTNCRVYTPYAFSGAAALSSVAVNDPKGVSFNTVIPPFSLTNEPRAVWADWTKTAVSPPPPPNTTVPEPTPLLLLGTGIAGLAALRRRQRR